MTAKEFSRLLISWYQSNPRELPWKNSKDPYTIWISEIILQQTRVAQGTPYYLRFIEQFPNLSTLADASESEVLKAWEGLGYYSRARNLHHTAIHIQKVYSGIFPDTYDQLIKLKGIGPYTAAALASFAFEKPHPAIDGNVIRVVSRLNGITEPVDTSEVRKMIQQYVESAISHALPSDFNQALMNLGATICKPSNPDCINCPFSQNCKASAEDLVSIIPAKSKRIVRKERQLHFIEIINGSKIVLLKREGNDIWKNLYCLPFVETSDPEFHADLQLWQYVEEEFKTNPELHLNIENSGKDRQVLTHQIIHGHFYKIKLDLAKNQIKHPYYLVESKNLSNFAFPKIIKTYIKDKGLLH